MTQIKTVGYKTVGYLRVSPKIEDIDNRIDVMTNETTAALYIERGIRGNVPLEERPEFQKVNSQLNVGDTLLIWWMTDFGLGFKLAYEVITELLSRGIIVKTYHQNLTFKPNDEQTQSMLRLIKGYEEIETHQRLMAAELGRRKLKGKPGEWKAKFKGRRANQELHQQIAQLLTSDKTLQSIADDTGASISTVKRVKAKLQRKEDHHSSTAPKHEPKTKLHHRTGKQHKHRHRDLNTQLLTEEKESL